MFRIVRMDLHPTTRIGLRVLKFVNRQGNGRSEEERIQLGAGHHLPQQAGTGMSIK